MDLRNFFKGLVSVLCITLSACATRPDSIKPLDISADVYEGKTCPELKQVVAKLAARESKLAADMNATANSQVATNLFGGALLAVTGVGYTRTVDNSSYGTALAEVRGHLIAARTQAKTIICDLPQPEGKAENKAEGNTESKVEGKAAEEKAENKVEGNDESKAEDKK